MLVVLAEAAIDGNGRAVASTDELLLAAEPVCGADGAPVLAAIATVPSATITETRLELFELLFVIAGGTTLAALALARSPASGSARPRDLTAAAGSITSGDLTVSPEVRSDDELGVLSGAFSSMTVPLRAMNADLRHAADEESRLRTRMEGVVAGTGCPSPSTSRASSPTSTPPPSCSSHAGRAGGGPAGRGCPRRRGGPGDPHPDGRAC